MRLGNPSWFAQVTSAAVAGLLREMVMMQALQLELTRKNNEFPPDLPVLAGLPDAHGRRGRQSHERSLHAHDRSAAIDVEAMMRFHIRPRMIFMDSVKVAKSRAERSPIFFPKRVLSAAHNWSHTATEFFPADGSAITIGGTRFCGSGERNHDHGSSGPVQRVGRENHGGTAFLYFHPL
jgi:hypothetical protein